MYPIPIKLVVVGDGCRRPETLSQRGYPSEKTALLISFTVEGEFPGDYIPTVFDNFTMNLVIGNKDINLCLWDTSGKEDYDRARPLDYPQTDVVLLIFSVVNRTSFDNTKLKWFPELRQHIPDVPILLVGTQIELRDDDEVLASLHQQGQQPITTQQGIKLARRMRAASYWECSAVTKKNLQLVFNEAIRAVIPDVDISPRPERMQPII